MTRHGKVLEIIALRKDGLRGQAFVIFEDVQAATAALQSEQGFTFFGKDLKIAYAKEKSDRIAKRDGTYVPRAKRRKREEKSAATAAATSAGTVDSKEVDMSTDSAPLPPDGSAPPATPQQQPTHILFAEKLPSECNEMMLAMLFRQVRHANVWLICFSSVLFSYVFSSFDALCSKKISTLNSILQATHTFPY